MALSHNVFQDKKTKQIKCFNGPQNENYTIKNCDPEFACHANFNC